jgi:starch-binding outer membrane protein, SusD/RagB family
MMKKIFILSMALLIFASSCNDDILDIKSQTQYSDASYFKEAPQFNEAVVSMYSCLLMKGMYARDYYFIFDLMSNDAANNIFLLGDLAQLHDYSFGATQPQMTDLWQTLYRLVLRSNLVLANANVWEPTLQEDIDKKIQYAAEAHFMRGYAYFQLVNLWGRVPLKLDYATQTEISSRAELTEIWASIEADFASAAAGLPVAHPSSDLGRVTKGAAVAMLGKSYLFQKKYADAEVEFEKLLISPYSYILNPSFDDQFSEGNNTSLETIFDVQHKWNGWGVGNQYYMFGGQEAWGGQATHTGRAQEYGFNDWNNVKLSNAAVAAFKYKDESNVDYIDPRAAFTFYGDVASGGDTEYCDNCTDGSLPYDAVTQKSSWRKYENYENVPNYGGPQSNINSQIIRLADVKLMLAEAKIEQNDLAGALEQINNVRNRAGAFQYSNLGSQNNARTLMMRERQIELMGEQTRWFDLVRWGVAKITLNAEKQAQLNKQPFADKNVLLPIPQIEKNTNSILAADVGNDWN